MLVRPLPILAIFSAAAIGVACSSAGLVDRSLTATDAPTNTGTDTGPPTIGGPEVSGYALSGRLRVDQAKGDRADLEIVTYGVDGAELCREPLPLALTIAAPPDDEPILAWWTASLDPQASLCDVDDGLFASVGIGAWDERLEVPLLQQGFDGANPFGLYLQEAEGEPVWVVGLAGTPSQLAGDDAADALVPLADGAYDIAFLVQAPWPTR